MFGIFKTYRDIKKGINDPKALGQELALDAIKTPVIISTIIAVIFFAALFILAFTGTFGGPFLFFKILFWVLFLPTLFIEAVLWMFIASIKHMMENARKKLDEKENVIEAEVTK